jgi:hypothetical protein
MQKSFDKSIIIILKIALSKLGGIIETQCMEPESSAMAKINSSNKM